MCSLYIQRQNVQRRLFIMVEFAATAVGHFLEELTNILKNQSLFAGQLLMVICQTTMIIEMVRHRLLDNVATILQQSDSANFTD